MAQKYHVSKGVAKQCRGFGCPDRGNPAAHYPTMEVAVGAAELQAQGVRPPQRLTLGNIPKDEWGQYNGSVLIRDEGEGQSSFRQFAVTPEGRVLLFPLGHHAPGEKAIWTAKDSVKQEIYARSLAEVDAAILQLVKVVEEQQKILDLTPNATQGGFYVYPPIPVDSIETVVREKGQSLLKMYHAYGQKRGQAAVAILENTPKMETITLDTLHEYNPNRPFQSKNTDVQVQELKRLWDRKWVVAEELGFLLYASMATGIGQLILEKQRLVEKQEKNAEDIYELQGWVKELSPGPKLDEKSAELEAAQRERESLLMKTEHNRRRALKYESILQQLKP